jgi:Ca2+-binding EF-hand superfamily protein
MKLMSLSLVVAFVSCAEGPGPVTPTTPVERQMIGLLQKFDRWDEDGDGYLTAKELGKTQQITGHPPEKVLAFYDTNHDRRVSLKEAQDALSRTDEAERAAKAN